VTDKGRDRRTERLTKGEREKREGERREREREREREPERENVMDRQTE